MWTNLQAHLTRSLDPKVFTPAATASELEDAVRPHVIAWVGERIRANYTPTGIRLRLIAELAAARPIYFAYQYIDDSIVPRSLMPLIRWFSI
ncbi:MAG: hypothetical protein AB7O88_26080, partial [Reyranellaceae bacterium]